MNRTISTNVNRYEPDFGQTTRSAILGREICRGGPRNQHEIYCADEATPNQGLSNKILGSLPAPDFKRLVPFFEPVALVKGRDLAGVNESDGFVYFPESGVVSHFYLLRNGGATAAAIIGNDGVVGLSTLFESRPPLYWTRVMIGGEGLRVKADVIKQEFVRGEGLQRLILAYMNERLSQLSQRAACNGHHKLAERLRTWLLMIDDRAEDVPLGLTHADIANNLGARRSVISGCCHALRESGLIDYKRGHIIILDRKTLEEEACECYQALKPV